MSRHRLIVATLLFLVLAIPSFAAPNRRSADPGSTFIERVWKTVKAFGGAIANYEIIVPIPKQP